MLNQITKPPKTAILEGLSNFRSLTATTDTIGTSNRAGKPSLLVRGEQEHTKGLFRDLDILNRYNFCTIPNERDYLPREFRKVTKFAERAQVTRQIIRKLEKHIHEHPAVFSAVKNLKRCKSYVCVKNGEPYSHYELCRSRLCGVCGHKHREDRRQEVQALLDFRKRGWVEPKSRGKSRLAFITLTIRSRKGWSCKEQVDELKRVWSRFNQRRDWRKFYALGLGGIKTMEVEYNREKDTYHSHYHGLLEIPDESTLTEVKEVIRYGWSQSSGGHIKVKSVDDEAGSIREVLKYLTKSFTKSGEVLAAIVKGTHNTRLFSVLGSWSKDRKAAFAKQKEMNDILNLARDKEPVEEPSPINPRTGEVASPEDGRYTLDALTTRAKKNDWNAIYLLRVFKYQMDRADRIRDEERWLMSLASGKEEPDGSMIVDIGE